MENPNWSKESLQAELRLHLTAARYLIKQLFERYGEADNDPNQLSFDDETLGIGAMVAEDLPSVG